MKQELDKLITEAKELIVKLQLAAIEKEEETFDNEKFFIDNVVLAVARVVNDAPESYKDELVYFDKDGKFIYSIEKNGNIWFNYSSIWNVLENKNNWNYEQTQTFLNSQLEKHLKMKGCTPLENGIHIIDKLEKQLKNKV